ncbi:MAG TPA: penicillin-binding protein 1C, partial [bacterium (Candidatus Stahlbacteria)]|nr:penicillin-binding protein 1C [Candidatus Stahlbacteria bacterium]
MILRGQVFTFHIWIDALVKRVYAAAEAVVVKLKIGNVKCEDLTPLLLLVVFLVFPIDRGRLYPSGFQSFDVCDRNGRLLRRVLSRDYKTSVWIGLDKISSVMIDATVLVEDKRFFVHNGVDPLALFRAAYDNVINRRIRSGGSTITMQVAKMALGLKGRSIFHKLIEMIYAVKLELHLSKAEILEIYLNRAPYGGQIYGVEAASWFYFGKPASQLSPGESALLSVIPRSPTRFNPYRSPHLVLKAKEQVLKRLIKNTIIDSLTFEVAIQESLQLKRPDFVFEAPHFVDFLLRELDEKNIKDLSRVVTTIDLDLQHKFESMLRTTLRPLAGYSINQGAILVMDQKTGEILAMVGSRDYFDEMEGQVNGCLSLRQPGSSIKPFLYLQALESGFTAADLLPDTLIEFPIGDGTRFAPRNYSNTFHGPTRVREALASSFNVPTVYLLKMLSPVRFYYLLKELKFGGLNEASHFYGLVLGLGSAEVTLLQLVNGYRAIGQNGFYEKERIILSAYDGEGHRIEIERELPRKVFDRDATFIVTDILSDNASRIKAFGDDSPLDMPFPCISKTGTSKGYRDNWCLGFTDDYVVGVWVGNFDGRSMQGVSGISGAAPLFRDLMVELHRESRPKIFDEPSSIVHLMICARTGKRARNICPERIDEVFISGTEPAEFCDLHCIEDLTANDGHEVLKIRSE